ncbi:MAG: protein kinase [Acidobacteriota bacterium]
MSLAPDQVLSHYRVAAKIGEGGMGEVYRATDTRLNRDVALKVLPEAFAADGDRMARFAREAQLLASLNHPNIGAIYGLEEAGGIRCLVLELIEGETLADRIGKGPLPLKEALDIARQIAEALEAAHDRGVIHRDLKPANVKLTPDGVVKVLDFGLAKALVGEAGSPDLSNSPTLTTPATYQGMILGTAAYMSPEQAKGLAADRRADIWSFGVVLHEMLAGRRLFASDNVSETLAAVLMKEPDLDELPAATPPVLRRLVARCLCKDPRERLQAIGEARIVIDAYRADPGAATRDEPEVATPVPGRTVTRLPWAIAAVLALGLAGTVWELWPATPSPAPVMRLRVEVGNGQDLTRDTGAPAVFSPDGRLLAYTAGEGSNSQIYLRHLDKAQGVPLSGTEGGRAPFFSPDGRWIGFLTNRALKKVSIAGGAPLSLAATNTSRGGTWSAGGVIVFAADITSGLSRIPDSGGTAEAITELAEGERSHRWPSFLPDGRHVLFMAQDRGAAYDDASIEVVDIETRERKVLHEGGTYPRYLPTGHLVYVRDGTLFAAPMDLTRLEVTGTPAPVLEGVLSSVGANTGDGTAFYDFSLTGNLAYVEGTVGTEQFTVLWTDRQGQETPLLAETRTYSAPRLSPDGRFLAVQISDDTGADLWVDDLERQVLTRLTFDGVGTNALPAWSPDSRRIAFASTKDTKTGTYWMPADGSATPELIWEDGRNQAPLSFSPTGQIAIHVLNPDTSWDLEVINFKESKASKPENFLSTPSVEIFPQFSPDGHWIAYVSNESGGFEVYVRPYPGPGGKWQISTDGGATPRWTKEGRELTYRSGDRWLAVPIEAEGTRLRVGRPVVILEGNYADVSPFPAHDVSTDGERFVVLEGETSGSGPTMTHLNLILNWFDEIRRLAPSGD